MVLLKVERQPERIDGKATGRTYYTADTVWPEEGQEHAELIKRVGSVLGRGYTNVEAVADWNRRAADDGHKVEGRCCFERPASGWTYRRIGEDAHGRFESAAIFGPLGHEVAHMVFGKRTVVSVEADGHGIVNALNSHNDLLAALRRQSSDAEAVRLALKAYNEQQRKIDRVHLCKMVMRLDASTQAAQLIIAQAEGRA